MRKPSQRSADPPDDQNHLRSPPMFPSLMVKIGELNARAHAKIELIVVWQTGDVVVVFPSTGGRAIEECFRHGFLWHHKNVPGMPFMELVRLL